MITKCLEAAQLLRATMDDHAVLGDIVARRRTVAVSGSSRRRVEMLKIRRPVALICIKFTHSPVSLSRLSHPFESSLGEQSMLRPAQNSLRDPHAQRSSTASEHETETRFIARPERRSEDGKETQKQGTRRGRQVRRAGAAKRVCFIHRRPVRCL